MTPSSTSPDGAAGPGTGRVALVGAGPGDPGLITRRGLDWLARADVVVYDRLANSRLLDHVPPAARRIFAGKSPEGHTLAQDEINALLVREARAGNTVVRLKGGDPYVFGRGGEEAQALRAAGVPFEVVPGITSAIAGPAYAGIPVTHRQLASSFAVVTGHEDADRPESRVDWAALATGPDTLVLLMGVERLPGIVERLVAGGRPPDTPAAMIEWATWPRQRTVVATLGTLVERARAAGLRAPAVTVIGEVVRLRDELDWFGSRPLVGRRIVVTRAREQASDLLKELADLGAEPIEFPTIRIEPIADTGPLDSAIARLAEYDWLVFTSVNGVRALFDRVWALGGDARAVGRARLCAIGPGTAQGLARYGLRADLLPERYIAESVAEALVAAGVRERRVLLARAAEARDVLRERLEAAMAVVDEVAVYRTVRDGADAEAVRAALTRGEIDAVTFTSSSTVRNFMAALGPFDPAAWPATTRVAAIGPITAATARELGLPVHSEAEEHTVPGLVRAVRSLFAT